MPNIKRLLPFILLLSLIISGTVSAKAVSDGKTTHYVYLPVVYKPVPPPPPAPPDYYSTSLYITPAETDEMYELGLAAGQVTQAAGRQDQLLILDYGQPWGDGGQYGTLLLKSPDYTLNSTNDMIVYTKQFITGFMAGSDGESKLDLGIGTNNFALYYGGVCTPRSWFCTTTNAYNHGKAWAQMVDELYDWVIQQGYGARVSVAGATDMELAWNYATITHAWADGFNDYDQNKYIYYNFGACEGCDVGINDEIPPDPDKDLYYDWTHAKVHYSAWGVSPAWPIPEIYLTNGWHAVQWANISKVGVDLGDTPMYFLSAMTQMQACDGKTCTDLDNTPVQGWNQLYDAINARPETAQYTIPYMTDIDWP